MYAGGPGKRKIKSFGTWKSSGFERKGEKETVSFSLHPHSGLLSLLPGLGRPLGLGSCPLTATSLGRGAGPVGQTPGLAGARWGPRAPSWAGRTQYQHLDYSCTAVLFCLQ